MPFSKAKPINGIPSLGKDMPTITLPMLLDFLSNHEIIHCPSVANRAFGVISPIFDGKIQRTGRSSDIPSANELIVCENVQDLECVIDQPGSFALLLLNKSSFVSFEEAGKDLVERVLIVRQQEEYARFIFELQNYFLSIFTWEKELDRIADHGGSLTDLLDASSSILGNFMFVSSSDFNVIARTSTLEPPDKMHQQMVETGLVPSATLTVKEAALEASRCYEQRADSVSDFDRFSVPLFEKHVYIGSVSMVCSKHPLTEGLRHRFLIMVRHMSKTLKSAWLDRNNEAKPHYAFLQKLLDHEPSSERAVNEQLKILGIPEGSHFKVLVIEDFESINPDRQARITQAAIQFKCARTLHLGYHGDFVILMYSSAPLRALSNKCTFQESQRLLYDPLGVVTGQSSPFTNIQDIDLAYRQAKIALHFRSSMNNIHAALETKPSEHAYSFDDTFILFLLESAQQDERFYEFCFSTSVAQAIYEEDRENGTNNLALLWYYITTWGNATFTAKKLNMHRNTVLYHIEKIENQYDIDVKDKTVRDRLILDYKALLLSLSGEKLGEIFSNSVQ